MTWTEEPLQEIFGNLNISGLTIDQAYLNIHSSTVVPLWLYQVSDNCHSCPYTLVQSAKEDFSIGNVFNTVVDTRYHIKYRLRTRSTPQLIPQIHDDDLYCQKEYHFGEFGVYNWNISTHGCSDIEVALHPVNIYLPILLNFLIYGLLWAILMLMYTNADRISSALPSLFRTKSRVIQTNTLPQIIVTSANDLDHSQTHLHLKTLRVKKEEIFSPRTRKRFRSLDTFRGLSTILMVFVTYEGGRYYFFTEATWDGLYLGSLPFPWLLWTMGVCIPISIQYYVKQGTPTKKICKKIIYRTIKLFLSGYVVMVSGWGTVWEPMDLTEIRLPGVLQRYAVCYLASALLILFAMKGDIKTISDPKHGNFRDLTFTWFPGTIILIVVLCHELLARYLPVPGCPTGYRGAAGLADDGKYPGCCIGGAASYIDRKLLSDAHIYKTNTGKLVYRTGDIDPEGLLGNLTALFQTWLGVQTGLILLAFRKDSSRLKRFFIWSILLGLAGGSLCQFKWTGGFIPMNKNLWSLSFVLVTSSLALVTFTVMYYFIDALRLWSGSPFYEPGTNSLFIYFGHYMTFYYFPWNWRVKNMNSHFMRLLEGLWGVSVWIVGGIWLKYKKIAWKF